MHVSIDEQMIARTPLEELKGVASATSLPIAVAGGLNSETVAQAAAAGASILIVGGAIIKAEKVSEATRTIKKAIGSRKAIPTGSFRKYTEADVREAFRKVSTPNLADAMQKRGVMTGLVPRIKHGTKLVGRALTVKTADGDWAKPVEAIDRAKSGDVIVIDVGGGPTAVWGELASNSCLVKGVAGVGQRDSFEKSMRGRLPWVRRWRSSAICRIRISGSRSSTPTAASAADIRR